MTGPSRRDALLLPLVPLQQRPPSASCRVRQRAGRQAQVDTAYNNLASALNSLASAGQHIPTLLSPFFPVRRHP